MNVSLTIDSTQLNRQMAAVHDALIGAGQYGDAATIVQDTGRLLLGDVIKKTPPNSLAQGRNATARDIMRAMEPLTEETFTNQKIRERFKELTEENWHSSNQDIETFMRRVGFKTARVLPFSERLHTSVRDNRGRVQRSKGVFVLEVSELKQYIARRQKNVGFMRAGWAPALLAIGGQVASWVSRHSRPAGFVFAELQGEKPSIYFGNRTKGIRQVRHAFESAFRTRIAAMKNRVKLILSGYATDVAHGIRPRKTAQLTAVGAPF